MREYGRRRGVSHVAVLKAIETGRLQASVTLDERKRKRIDPALADREWFANTDPGQQRGVHAPAGSATQPDLFPGASPPRPPKPEPLSDEQRATARSLSLSRAMKEAAEARIRQLELEVKTGAVVKADEVAQGAATVGRRMHDTLQNIAPRIAGMVAAQQRDQRAVEALLQGELSKALELLAVELEGLARELGSRKGSRG